MPEYVPRVLYSGVIGCGVILKDNVLYNNFEATVLQHIRYLEYLTPGQSVGLLFTHNGQLHIFINGKHCYEMATELPGDIPLWGIADVFGKCTKIKSEFISGESSGSQSPSQ